MLKYYDDDCPKGFFWSLLFQWSLNFLEKEPILDQKCQFVEKTTNQQTWKFCKVKHWSKPRIQNIANTTPLNSEFLKELTHFIFTSWLEKFFEGKKKI